MDTDGQLTFEDDTGTIRYKEAYQYILRRDFSRALDIFLEIREGSGYEHIEDIIKIMEFWTDRYQAVSGIRDLEEKTKKIRLLWEEFENFYIDQRIGFAELKDQLKKVIFRQVSEFLVKRFQKQDVPDIPLLIDLGKIYLVLQEEEKSEEIFIYANRLQPGHPEILAYLSEIYMLSNEEEKAKIMLREAFLIDPDRVPVDEMSSDLISLIREHTKKEKHERNRARWMPVVANYKNILDRKRELTRIEKDKLILECEELEKILEQDKKIRESVRPLLINKYLVFLDSVLVSGNTDGIPLAKIEERLKDLDPMVYETYINKVFRNGDGDGRKKNKS